MTISSNNSGTVIEAQADWLTCSAHGENAAAAMLDLAKGLATEEVQHGARSVPWRSMGYVGKHVGRVEWGQRDRRSTMLRLSGDAAAQHLAPALALAHYVTRLDLAVTLRTDPPDPLLGRNTYTLAEMFHSKNPLSALPWFVGDAAKGYTCYIGKRRSENFFRLYNKEAEAIASDDDDDRERYRACWRYELETKGTVAMPLAERLVEEENKPAFVQGYLYQWATAHGIEPAFGQFGHRKLISGFRRRSDALTKLQHLQKNVRPTVDWLREVGRLEDVLRVLGLDENP